MDINRIRTRWAAVGAAVAITLGGGGIGITHAVYSSGPKPIYTSINPCRLVDLRPAPFTVGPRTAGIGPAETITFDGWGAVGNCSLPTGTAGLALNVTAVSPSLATDLRLWAADGAEPVTSNLNPAPGQPPTPNAVNVGLSPSGQFKILNKFGTVSVIIDVVGVYQDHDHDDIYYQKGQTYAKVQVDAALAAKANSTDVYTKAEVDAGYVSTEEDTYHYVPGSLLKIHSDDGPADVYFDNSSDAIVRKTSTPGSMQVIIPVPLPAELGGKWGKLVNFRVSYKVDNVNSYIDSTWLVKSNNTGGHVVIGQSSANRTSTAYTSYVVDCSDPGCQLAWVPNGNYVTVVMELKYGGTGDPHDITIGGVLMRVSYDG